MAALNTRTADPPRWLLAGLVTAGVTIVALARAWFPLAPPLYDGIGPLPQPFCYVSPPPNLASSNCQPSAGQADLEVSGGTNKLATVQTDDKQVLVFFPQGTLASAAPKITVRISPQPSPPPAPAGNQLVGNAYVIELTNAPTPPSLLMVAQALLRTPPQSISSVQEFYDGSWHDTEWAVQQDYVNVTIQHLGVLAAFDNGRHSSPGPSPRPGGTNLVTIVEFGVVLVAVVIIVTTIVARQVRARNGAESAGPAAGTGSAGRSRSRPRQRRDTKSRGRGGGFGPTKRDD